jgi:hypothetical protein
MTNWVHESQWFSGTPTNPVVMPSDAIFIRGATGSGDRTIGLTGEAVSIDGAGRQINEGYNAMAFPYSCMTAINDLDFFTDGGQIAPAWANIDQSDRIYVWNGVTFDIYGLHWMTNWVHESQWFSGTPTTAELQVGDAFFYRTVVGGGGWAYDENLPYPQAFQ